MVDVVVKGCIVCGMSPIILIGDFFYALRQMLTRIFIYRKVYRHGIINPKKTEQLLAFPLDLCFTLKQSVCNFRAA